MEQDKFVRNYLNGLGSLLPKLDDAAITKAIECLRDAAQQGNTIYICGNGGSASIASQMVVDIVKGASTGREPRFKMICLNDSISTITAYANDVDYDCVFVEQLKNFAGEGDVLLAISGSGNSGNVLRAVEYANQVGCKTIGLTTSEGGKLKDISQLPLVVPSSHMGHLEDSFFIMTHVLCYAFIEKVF
ncbi:MAG: SIS domain-containing protein [Pirellulales bacterium]|nr:SIS domain-containing protein [Pirellulales bacterium]